MGTWLKTMFSIDPRDELINRIISFRYDGVGVPKVSNIVTCSLINWSRYIFEVDTCISVDGFKLSLVRWASRAFSNSPFPEMTCDSRLTPEIDPTVDTSKWSAEIQAARRMHILVQWKLQTMIGVQTFFHFSISFSGLTKSLNSFMIWSKSSIDWIDCNICTRRSKHDASSKYFCTLSRSDNTIKLWLSLVTTCLCSINLAILINTFGETLPVE